MRFHPMTLVLPLVLACPASGSDEGATTEPSTASSSSSSTDGQTSQTSGQTSQADGSSSGGQFDVECSGATPILQPDGSPSGFETCDDGFVHRVSALTCVVPEPPATCEARSGEGSCTTSAECTDGPNGACVDDGIIDPSISLGCHCEYACETDADCGDGQACACATAAGLRPHCISGGCGTDDDCQGMCGMDRSEGECGGSTYTLACLDPDSECRPGSCPQILDCNEDAMVSPPCVIASGEWACEPIECFTSCG